MLLGRSYQIEGNLWDPTVLPEAMPRQPDILFPVLLLAFVALAVVTGMLAGAHLLGPRRRTAVKQMPYESGMDPIGNARARFDIRYYLVAIVFLIFDVELLFLFPGL